MAEVQHLREIANQGLEDPSLLRRIVCKLRENDTFDQKHRDKRKFDLQGANALNATTQLQQISPL